MTIRVGGVSWLLIIFIISARLILCTLRRGIGHRMKGSRRLDTCPENCAIGLEINSAIFVKSPRFVKGPSVKRVCTESCKRYRHI